MFTKRCLKVAILSFALFGCGESPEAETDSADIIGGTLSTRENVVAVTAIFNKETTAFCTGTVIAPTIVLTAAHCVVPPRKGAEVEVLVSFGNVLDDDGLGFNVTYTTRTFIHPMYETHSENGDGYDMAVIELPEPIRVKPAKLNTRPLPKDLATVIQHGFGRDKDGATGTKRLIVADVNEISEREFGAGWSGNQVCKGDSGGPSFASFGGQNDVLVGVHSWGPGSLFGACRRSGFDARVDTSIDFLRRFVPEL